MTILHSGASRKFADNWQKIFGKGKSSAGSAKAGGGFRGRAAAKRSTKKTARTGGAVKSAKKASGKKMSRKLAR
jgi:hypothetical protein